MQTIGERLEEARKKKGISIREAAEATKIRGDYLQKFESNHFDIGLTEIYTRGFLRTYATFLKVPADRIMSDYAALGRGDVRPRQPNREVYGRMDISVASASEAADRGAPPAEAAEPEPAPARAAQPHYPRGHNPALPSGPDPAVIFKWVKIGGVAILVIVLAFVIKALVTGGSSSPSPAQHPTATPAASAPTPQAPREATLTLIATNPVHVKVQVRNADESYGETLFDGALGRGESRTIPRPGALYITASACENLILQINGKQYPMRPSSGYGTGALPAP